MSNKNNDKGNTNNDEGNTNNDKCNKNNDKCNKNIQIEKKSAYSLISKHLEHVQKQMWHLIHLYLI